MDEFISICFQQNVTNFFNMIEICFFEYFSHQTQHLFEKFLNFLYWVLTCSQKCEICFRFLSFISYLEANLVEFSCPQVGMQVYSIGNLVGRQAQSGPRCNFRKINHGHNFKIFSLTFEVRVQIQGILRIFASGDEMGHRIGYHFMDIYNMFTCKCKSLCN